MICDYLTTFNLAEYCLCHTGGGGEGVVRVSCLSSVFAMGFVLAAYFWCGGTLCHKRR